jgi:hypothetical protein
MGAAALAPQRKQRSANVEDESPADVEQLRRELLVKIQNTPAEQLTILAAVIEEIWSSER